MRCQKARSLLSAYCNDELNAGRQAEVGEHLAGCPACRGEETSFRAIRTGAAQIPRLTTSATFNATLLNRIAHERFAETRRDAYFPRVSPRLFPRQLVPAFASALAVLLVAGVSLSGKFSMLSGGETADVVNRGADDSYLTVSAEHNPNLTAALPNDWSLQRQLDRSRRIDQLSSAMAPSWATLTSSTMQSGGANADFASSQLRATHHQLRPIVRQYVLPNGTVITIGGR